MKTARATRTPGIPEPEVLGYFRVVIQPEIKINAKPMKKDFMENDESVPDVSLINSIDLYSATEISADRTPVNIVKARYVLSSLTEFFKERLNNFLFKVLNVLSDFS